MYEIKKLEGSKYEVKITREKDDVAKMKEEAIKTLKKNVKMDGFRQGHVPDNVIEKNYEGNIKEEMANKVIEDEYQEILEKEGIKPIDYLKIKEFNVDDDKLELVGEIQVMPEIKIGEYKGIEAEKAGVEITDEVLEAELDRLREANGKLKEIEDAELATFDDVVNIDFEGFVDGEAFAGGKAEGFDLKLGSKSFIDNFEDQIAGHKKGEDIEVNVTFPEEYHSADLAGKPAMFKVKVNTIKRLEKPELNDEFAKDQNFENVEELKTKTKERLENSEKMKADNEFQGKVLEQIVANAELDIPEVLIEREIDQRLRQFDSQLRMQGMDLGKYVEMTGQSIESMRAPLKEDAEKAVRADLVISEISKLENIAAEADEVEKKIEEVAAMYGMEKAQLVNEAKRAGNYNNFVNSIKYDLIARKTIEFLMKEAKEK
ncbi:trigger factor [Sebaldella sp. S0638]|uniref:trigger factor n=1 Tax=Sebaldella sp. S0638 TaxID=2957809 RepID=UPI00209F522E|nr:trigger factor [Sebaldella sp. S0638]MCP1225273.1 trigger factor [Sebaldella sp. S0638]